MALRIEKGRFTQRKPYGGMKPICEAIAKLQIGDSFLTDVPGGNLGNALTYIGYAFGRKFSAVTQSDGKRRVGRVS